MINLRFTKEEKQHIQETLDVVLDDLEEMIKLFPLDYYDVEIDNLKLYFSQEYIKLKKEQKNTVVLSSIKDVQINSLMSFRREKIRERKPFHQFTSEEQGSIVSFLENYDAYRNQIVEELKKTTTQKNDILTKLQMIKAKYSGEVIVDFGPVATQNLKTLEVTNENGRNVGTIDFGNRIVKIITDGDIVLKKVETVKEKIKAKELI